MMFEDGHHLPEAIAMTTLALSALINSTPRLLARLLDYWTEFLNGIEESPGHGHALPGPRRHVGP